VLCTLADLPDYEGKGEFGLVLVFPPRRDPKAIFQLRRRIDREGYQTIVVLWDGKETRVRPKLFAFACGIRRLLVFNENLDCNYFRPSFVFQWLKGRWKKHPSLPGRHRLFSFSLLSASLQPLLRWILFPLRLLVLFGLTAELALGGWFNRNFRRKISR